MELQTLLQPPKGVRALLRANCQELNLARVVVRLALFLHAAAPEIHRPKHSGTYRATRKQSAIVLPAT